ncbi:hypothetical protein ACH5RR_019741 [Cinchona calisaya]|uniref:WRKY19-like zinc finger domain-containing protein n=1 Tax=Cinchona calisaya TaxID=153742 RepID=A0ABD2ZQ87_9GENT
MDKVPVHYTANLAKVSTDLNKIANVRSSDSAIPVLGLDSSGIVNSYCSRGSKRKLGVVDGSSLFLELGRSSSSCTSVSCGKEIEEESSIHLGLNTDLRLGNHRTHYANEFPYGTAKAHEMRRPVVDLELSLSTGPSESDITTVTQGSSPHKNNLEAPAAALVATIQLVDEGSTSSRWKCGPLVPPLQSSGTITIGYPVNNFPTLLTPNISSAALGMRKNSLSWVSAAVHQPQQLANAKTCMFEGCKRGARGASGLCIAHGGGRRCQRAGCQKGAEGRTVFCKAHGGGRRCQHLGCTKSAEGRTDFCIGHGGGRRCNHDGCTRAARGKSGLCIRHGGGKRCKMENCIKSAEGISGLCISHGGGRRCQYPACSKGAQGSTMFCKAHGGGKRCTYLGCTKGAEGSTPFCKGHGGGKRCTFEGCTKSVHGGTSFCVSHGGGKRCSMPGCTKSARGRTNFCVRHGGGKRCRHEGCTKSAQGSTDFCKAHGGGKRCSWGQVGSEFGGQSTVPCDKFARGKSGLCAAHTAQMQENLIQGDGVMPSILENPLSNTIERIKGIFVLSGGTDTTHCGGMSVGLSNHGCKRTCTQIPPQDNSDKFLLPEGRVHGGSLMAMLRDTSFQTGNSIVHGGEVERGNTYPVSHSWV